MTNDVKDAYDTSANFPKGYAVRKDGIIEIDPEIVYPAILAVVKPEKAELDQYWVEVAYQCAKLEAMRLVSGTSYDPRAKKTPSSLRINVLSRKDSWALKNFPRGKGPEAASQGREARNHYLKWRGFIPA